MTVKLIVAKSINGVIGKNNKLPWHDKEELKWFVANTRNTSLIVGRKTAESFVDQGIKLIGRKVVYISREDRNLPTNQFVWADTPEKALELAKFLSPSGDICVAGGAEVYRAMIKYVDCAMVSTVYVSVEGDTRFPTDILSEFHRLTTLDFDTFSVDVMARDCTCTYG